MYSRSITVIKYIINKYAVSSLLRRLFFVESIVILIIIFNCILVKANMQIQSASQENVTSTINMTIQEYADYVRMKEAVDQKYFQTAWSHFLKNQGPKPTREKKYTSACLRGTWNYLIETGGLKEKLARASEKRPFGFSLSRPIDEPNTNRTGSFHRLRRSIFVDLDKLGANEWLMIFVHEVAHSLDSELIDSLSIYNNEALIKYFADLGKKNTQLVDVSKSDRKNLDTWLTAGLNRGFLAEYRAWLLTFLIYEEGLKDGTFLPIDWLENLKKNRPAGLDIRIYILQSLSPDWVDPTEGIFSNQFIRDALTQLRQKIYNNPLMVEMGYIENLLHN